MLLQLFQLLLVRLNNIGTSEADDSPVGDAINPSPSYPTESPPIPHLLGPAYSLQNWISRSFYTFQETLTRRCRRYRNLLNGLSVILKTAQWIQHTLYLFEQTSFQDPIMAVAGIVISRDPNRLASLPSHSSDTTPYGPSSGQSSQSPSFASTSPVTTKISNSSSSSSVSDGRRVTALALIMGVVMAVRVFDWIRRSDASSASDPLSVLFGDFASSRHARDISLTPPPPTSLPVARGSLLPPSDPKLCPICRQTRENPCASTGGYVFCLGCLSEALDKKEVCPVTGAPCKPLDVIRIYENHEHDR